MRVNNEAFNTKNFKEKSFTVMLETMHKYQGINHQASVG